MTGLARSLTVNPFLLHYSYCELGSGKIIKALCFTCLFFFFKVALTLQCIISQNGQARFKDLAANAKFVSPVWNIMY